MQFKKDVHYMYILDKIIGRCTIGQGITMFHVARVLRKDVCRVNLFTVTSVTLDLSHPIA